MAKTNHIMENNVNSAVTAKQENDLANDDLAHQETANIEAPNTASTEKKVKDQVCANVPFSYLRRARKAR